ncbi:MAG: sigma-70 family RNA polymerase sigma factor [Candidatus Eisenbacteria sp.]|nr:sigma-70 family RNA polymerase sigma factor [Candidatus Eisenbacteria bacterium]
MSSVIVKEQESAAAADDGRHPRGESVALASLALAHPVQACIPYASIEELRPVWIRRAVRSGIAREDAEDLFQEGLLAALEGIGRLRVAAGQSVEDAFLAWFWGILRHKLVSELRRRRRIRRHLEERRAESVERAGAGNLATHVQSSLGLLERSSPEAARVLRQRFFDGRELREMAADLGVSVPTACRRVQAALAEIRSCVELVLS